MACDPDLTPEQMREFSAVMTGDVELHPVNIWRAGFAAGRAAATPDQPNGNPYPENARHSDAAVLERAQRAAWFEGWAACAAASPDERLREAGEAMAAWVRDNTCGDECGDNCEAGANALARWDNTLARLAAADREAPECPSCGPDCEGVTPACFGEVPDA